MNNDIIRYILESCDLITLIRCRTVSQNFKRIIDEEAALEEADLSGLSLRQRRSITDSTFTPAIIHILRKAVIINVDGTSASHNGAMKLVTPFLKEIHVERCPRVDLGTLTLDLAAIKWTPKRAAPVTIYTKTRGMQDYYTITKPLYDWSEDVAMLSRVCTCGYVNMAAHMGRPNQSISVGCHTCGAQVDNAMIANRCSDCNLITCDKCLFQSCSVPHQRRKCKGCIEDEKCSLCSKRWCGRCDEKVTLSRCYGCAVLACSECRPSMSNCLVCKMSYCEECTGMMAGMENWCCSPFPPEDKILQSELIFFPEETE